MYYSQFKNTMNYKGYIITFFKFKFRMGYRNVLALVPIAPMVCDGQKATM